MKIQIQDFFLKEVSGNNFCKFSGSLKILLPEKGIQILGINVRKKNNQWFFMLPGIKTFHNETGETVGFPFVSFIDQKEKETFFHNMKESAINYIIERIKDNTLKLPVKNEAKLVKNTDKYRSSKKIQNGMHKKRPFVAKTNQSNN